MPASSTPEHLCVLGANYASLTHTHRIRLRILRTEVGLVAKKWMLGDQAGLKMQVYQADRHMGGFAWDMGKTSAIRGASVGDSEWLVQLLMHPSQPSMPANVIGTLLILWILQKAHRFQFYQPPCHKSLASSQSPWIAASRLAGLVQVGLEAGRGAPRSDSSPLQSGDGGPERVSTRVSTRMGGV